MKVDCFATAICSCWVWMEFFYR